MIKNLTGQTINKFHIIKDSGKRSKQGNVIWEVQCQCGNIKLLTRDHIYRNQSCGCLRASLIQKKHFRGYKEISKSYWNSIKKGAAQRGLQISISIKDAWDLFVKQDKCCALTGVELKFASKSFTCDGTASLDRIDSDKGYIKDNIQWVHKEINFMKQQFSTDKFIDWCQKVIQHQTTRLEVEKKASPKANQGIP